MLDEVIAAARDDGAPADTIIRAISRRAAMPGRRTAARCASSSIGRSGARASVPVIGPRGDARARRRRCRASPFDRPATAPAAAGRRRGASPAGLRSGVARGRTVARSSRATSGRPCSSARRSTCASTSPKASARRPSLELLGGGADTAQPVRPAPAARHRGSMSATEWPHGLVEVQDEGSQLIALACAPRPAPSTWSTCAPAPAARRWRSPPRCPTRASSPPIPTARACRSLAPRAARAGAAIVETRLLDAGKRGGDARRPRRAGRRRPGRCAVLGHAAPGGAIPRRAGG